MSGRSFERLGGARGGVLHGRGRDRCLLIVCYGCGEAVLGSVALMVSVPRSMHGLTRRRTGARDQFATVHELLEAMMGLCGVLYGGGVAARKSHLKLITS